MTDLLVWPVAHVSRPLLRADLADDFDCAEVERFDVEVDIARVSDFFSKGAVRMGGRGVISTSAAIGFRSGARNLLSVAFEALEDVGASGRQRLELEAAPSDR